ncbi:hypothetical protein M6B38_323105 [Iris pallida]|uniref:Uncharacterized protein n=1 Tax=Iris pallida TaxID=29817 RepID=A0AAX6HAF9_IRIPA|nr:hypothetical protein M6B38_323105 [Iris pallida]
MVSRWLGRRSRELQLARRLLRWCGGIFSAWRWNSGHLVVAHGGGRRRSAGAEQWGRERMCRERVERVMWTVF